MTVSAFVLHHGRRPTGIPKGTTVDRMQQVRDAVKAAEANGWEILNGSTVRRISEHEAPQYAIDNGWWPGRTYQTIEFLGFVFGQRADRVPKVVYKVAPCPWIAKRDRLISFKQSLELLAQPVAESDVHN